MVILLGLGGVENGKQRQRWLFESVRRQESRHGKESVGFGWRCRSVFPAESADGWAGHRRQRAANFNFTSTSMMKSMLLLCYLRSIRIVNVLARSSLPWLCCRRNFDTCSYYPFPSFRGEIRTHVGSGRSVSAAGTGLTGDQDRQSICTRASRIKPPETPQKWN